jgi:hypothetical protein
MLRRIQFLARPALKRGPAGVRVHQSEHLLYDSIAVGEHGFPKQLSHQGVERRLTASRAGSCCLHCAVIEPKGDAFHVCHARYGSLSATLSCAAVKPFT